MTDQPFPPEYLDDIYTEPDASVQALDNLGPLAHIAGVWEGTSGVDTHPQVDGPETEKFVERWTFEPIDPQTNETFDDQVGYLLWEPATTMQTLRDSG